MLQFVYECLAVNRAMVLVGLGFVIIVCSAEAVLFTLWSYSSALTCAHTLHSDDDLTRFSHKSKLRIDFLALDNAVRCFNDDIDFISYTTWSIWVSPDFQKCSRVAAIEASRWPICYRVRRTDFGCSYQVLNKAKI